MTKRLIWHTPAQAQEQAEPAPDSERTAEAVTVLDADAMDDDSLQQAVGLLAQLEARAPPAAPPTLIQIACTVSACPLFKIPIRLLSEERQAQSIK